MDTAIKEKIYRALISNNLKKVVSTGELQTLNKLTLLYSKVDQLSERDYIKSILIYFIVNRDFAENDLRILTSLIEKLSIEPKK